MLSNSYTNDKYSANTTSIFVPIQYKPQIEAVIEYQNTKQGDNGEFICAIELEIVFAGTCGTILCTLQWQLFTDVIRELFDDSTLLDLLLAIDIPVVGCHDLMLEKELTARKHLGNVWFNGDWLLPVPSEVSWAAKTFVDNNEADLLCIKPVGSSNNLWEACFQKDDGETIQITYSLQTETSNKVVEHMLQSSTKGVFTQNW